MTTTTQLKAGEQATGRLFGTLFSAYDDKKFVESVELLEKRFRANNFPIDWFKGKKMLDVGCGGGRYSLALAKMGAGHCTGVDISEEGIADAKKRALDLGITNVDFQVSSALSLPFEDDSFDGVIFSGVLMATSAPITALNEIARIMKSGGMLYLLVYATEGVWWPLVEMLRPIAQQVGFKAMEKAVTQAGFPVNKRRIFLDDLFVSYTDFYSWECLSNLLEDKGFEKIDRWKTGRLDHEENLDRFLEDIKRHPVLFSAAAEGADAQHRELLTNASRLASDVVSHVERVRSMWKEGRLSEEDAMRIIVGQGHHRVVCWKR